MNAKSKSHKCLSTCHEAFLSGETASAIKNLNITFNHSTNKDWSRSDTKSILNFLSWLYFSEYRFEQAAELFERAAVHIRLRFGSDDKNLSLLHYNLAELYFKLGETEHCETNFLMALDLLELQLGVRSKSYMLVHKRYVELCHKLPGEQVTDQRLQTRRHLRLILDTESVHALTLRTQ